VSTKTAVTSKQRYLGVAAIVLGIIPILAFVAANLVNHFMTAPSPHKPVFYAINTVDGLAVIGGIVLVSTAAYRKVVAGLLALFGLIAIVVVPATNLTSHFMTAPNHPPVFYTVLVANILLVITGILALKAK